MVSWIAAIDLIDRAGFGDTVGFFPRGEVDAVGVLEFKPVAVVDARLVELMLFLSKQAAWW